MFFFSVHTHLFLFFLIYINRYFSYLSVLPHITARCRLTLREELTCARLAASSSFDRTSEMFEDVRLTEDQQCVLRNRREFLEWSSSKEKNREGTIRLVSPNPIQAVDQYDEVIDTSVIQNENQFTSIISKLSTMSYTRPKDADLHSLLALQHLNRYLQNGLSLKGASESPGFLFLYELMTAGLKIKLLPDDNSYNWGALLTRFLPASDRKKKSLFMSTLRMLAFNESLSKTIPKYEDNRRFKFSTVFRGQNVIQRLMSGIREHVKEKSKEIRWPQPNRVFVYSPSIDVRIDSLNMLCDLDRTLVAVRVEDTSREVLKIKNKELESGGLFLDLNEFCKPLGSICEEFTISTKTGEKVQKEMEFLKRLEKHPRAKGRAAANIISRVSEDLKHYSHVCEGAKRPSIRDLLSIPKLVMTLQKIRDADAQLSTRALQAAMRLARKVKIDTRVMNQQPGVITEQRRRLAFLLRRCHGQESEAWIELLLQCTMSKEGVEKLIRLNPFIDSEQAERIISLCVLFMLVSNRQDHIERCLLMARSLMSGDDEKSKKLQSEKLAALLRTERYYIDNKTNEFDPRLLAFEFIHNIILRKSQVELINTFKEKIKNGKSTCHQMLMGSGKTTVVAPLLSLILNKFSTLTTQVVPRSLLEFSRSVVRQRFSAIVCKPVYTFRFDRFNGVPSNVHANLLTATSTRGIVISDPTSLKSFALKFLELLNARCELSVALENHKDAIPRRGALLSLMNRVAVHIGLSEDTEAKTRSHVERTRLLLTKDIHHCTEILNLFNQGVLILDEVDLILHPLKSELNWPLGEKEALDFTQGDGLRWLIPFHLLDAVFYAGGGSTVMNLKECGNNVTELLRKIREEVREASETFDVLLTPHLVLSQRTHVFYKSRLLPLLVKWMLVWLFEGQRFKGMKEKDVTDYLLYNKKSSGIFSATDEQMKTLNLTRDWLHSFAPHVLSKINRVHFGILSPNELERMKEEETHISRARRLLAIPFVAKDVPSRASEYAHPDVVIGLTILAYRYNGLRRADFRNTLVSLRDQMQQESGPYNRRKSCKKFANWIIRAGGRVRGSKKRRKIETEEIDLIVKTDESKSSPTRGWDVAPLTDEEIFQDVWPLQLLDMSDETQVEVLHRRLQKSPHVVLFYLSELIFPETCQHQGLKLSASGQELGSSILFNQRLGFSGTPSDLAPHELGKVQYERGSDGKMVHFLTSSDVVSVSKLSVVGVSTPY